MNGELESGDSDIPDRLLHPQDYEHHYGAVEQ